MAYEIHVDDVGIVFRLTLKNNRLPVDISTVTTKEIIFMKPDKTTVTKTASFGTDGTDGVLTYTVIAGDLNIKGNWKVQARVVLPSGNRWSSIGTFTVFANLTPTV